ncbi:FUSC family protein [Gramella sp. GC03-9]|uniref:FUSC family protein n=1 Tax=Christiangramia oceanisediminis TaxID=2920386 RepID=A0A9X2KY21_9FLAO|nr:FUSC family membrane protein [Gramella oceanisediminis]MCP9200361.1 FUSC family protein [Gramella oceanisediminis]
MKAVIKQHQLNFIKFLRSTDFSKAIVLTIAILVPIGILSSVGKLEIGISIAMGCLLSSPSDVPGSFKHKVLGILSAVLLGSVSFLIAGYAAKNTYAILPMLFLMMFGVSFLSVYGFRASLVTFSGLLAVVLSFANLSTGIEIWEKSLLIAVGGIWYLLISIGWYFLRPQRATEQLLGETMELTAEYLRLRSRLLLGSTSDVTEIQKSIFTKQSELNEHHESLREILISSRTTSGNSGYTRKRLLIFIDLVDILELAMANPLDHQQMKTALKDNQEELKHLMSFNNLMAEQLEKMAISIHRKSELQDNRLPEHLKKAREAFRQFKSKVDIQEKRELLLIFRNLIDYQAKQVQKINNIDRILRNLEENKKLVYKSREVKKFISHQDYDLKILALNFNFESAIFRHSLRLAIIVIIGYLVGEYFSVQNSYWILLTIVVIMRPNYGLTKERTRKRIVGTLIGGAIAISIVYITQNQAVYTILGLLSLTLAFSLIQRNYTTAAIFVTLSIIFIYAILKSDVLEVIQFRIVDTLIGAGLAALGNLILWPKWELQGIRPVISASVEANRQYLAEIDWYYHRKDKLPVSYKLVRKKAFLEIGNLSGAFQRMTQEPRSKQANLGLVYEIVELNQTFLSALASLGTYIRSHPTTKPSEAFEQYSNAISNNLIGSIQILEGKRQEAIKKTELGEAGKSFRQKFDKLASERDEEIRAGKMQIDRKTRHILQEAHLVIGQLEWLYDLSEKLVEKVKRLNEINE